ncbi:DUF4215 domain-containing protein [Patescibacteria group bacterium]|nr:DUF4215 domain-containing protein [Patescibacteria group bacterium]
MKIRKNLLKLKLFFATTLLLFAILPSAVVSAVSLYYINNLDVSVNSVYIGDTSQVQVSVSVKQTLNPPRIHWDIFVDFGDGGPTRSSACAVDSFSRICTVSFSHQYGSVGKYTVVARACDGADPTRCTTSSAIAEVKGIVCGDGKKEGDEECDDGNTVSGDGCSSQCKIEYPSQPPVNNDLNPLKASTFGELFRDVAGSLFWIAIILGPLLIIAGGLMIIFAGLDPGKIALGKKIILYTAVILGIILIIKAMTAFFAPDITFQ